MSDVRIVAGGLGFPEGPVAMADGSVILTEIRNRRCSRVTPDGTVCAVLRRRRRAQRPRGRPGWRALSLQQRRQPLRRGRLDGAGAASPTTSSATSSGSTRRPARPSCSTASATATSCRRRTTWCSTTSGGFYFTDLGKRYARHRDHGGLYYALPDGSKITLAYPILSANGCGLSPDEKTLYVADTESARLWAFDIEAPGVLRKRLGPSPHGGRCIMGLAGIGALRQPGGDGHRQHLRRDA